MFNHNLPANLKPNITDKGMQSQKSVSAYFTGKQILPFGFERRENNLSHKKHERMNSFWFIIRPAS